MAADILDVRRKRTGRLQYRSPVKDSEFSRQTIVLRQKINFQPRSMMRLPYIVVSSAKDIRPSISLSAGSPQAEVSRFHSSLRSARKGIHFPQEQPFFLRGPI